MTAIADYKVSHWIYVVLSRVRSLNCLVLNEKLDEARSYDARTQVLQWEKNMKEKVERKTFRDRGQQDYEQYLVEEQSDLLSALPEEKCFNNLNEVTDYCKEQKNSPCIITQDFNDNVHHLQEKGRKNNEQENCKARNDTSLNHEKETNPSSKLVTQDFTQDHNTHNRVTKDIAMNKTDSFLYVITQDSVQDCITHDTLYTMQHINLKNESETIMKLKQKYVGESKNIINNRRKNSLCQYMSSLSYILISMNSFSNLLMFLGMEIISITVY